MKKELLGIVAVVSMLLPNLDAFGQEMAVVDVSKIVSNYSKAQDVSMDLKVKEAELKTMVAEAEKSIKSANVSEQKGLEEKYKNVLAEKQALYRQQYEQQLQSVETDIEDAIKTVSQSKNIKIVLNKNSVVYGGDDLTEEVLKALNVKK